MWVDRLKKAVPAFRVNHAVRNTPSTVDAWTASNPPVLADWIHLPPEDPAHDGKLIGARGQLFAAETPLADIPAVAPTSGPVTGETFLYTNGIGYSFEGQQDSMQRIADATGAKVIGLRNANAGFAKDMLQVLTDKLNLGDHGALNSQTALLMRELEAGRGLHLWGHSHGALILARALHTVKDRLVAKHGPVEATRMLQRVKVETFAGVATHYPDGPRYVHYINRADFIPTTTGLGHFAEQDPLVHPGQGAKVRYFTDFEPDDWLHAHDLNAVYLAQRVPFEQAYAS
jgi:hypothetical protein